MAKSTFGFERPQDSPGFLLWQTTMVWQRAIKAALEIYDVTHAQFVLMAALMWSEEHEQTVTQVMLVRFSNIDKMTVSHSLRALVQNGFVSRTENTQDTRAKSVSLTKSGKTLIKKLVPLVENVDAQFFGALGAREQKTLIQLFNALLPPAK